MKEEELSDCCKSKYAISKSTTKGTRKICNKCGMPKLQNGIIGELQDIKFYPPINSHEFTHTNRISSGGITYILIYCKNCGQVSYDQSHKDFKKIITKCS